MGGALRQLLSDDVGDQRGGKLRADLGALGRAGTISQRCNEDG